MRKWYFNQGVQGNNYLSLFEGGDEWVRVGEEVWDEDETYGVQYLDEGKWRNAQRFDNLLPAIQYAEDIFEHGYLIDYRGDWR